MAIRLPGTAAFLFLLASTLQAQSMPSPVTSVNGPLHDLTDARSAALGESWSARAHMPSAWNSNPASLAGSIGAGAEYASRDGESFLMYRQRGIGAWCSTPIGTFALNYRNLDLGRWRITFENGLTSDEEFSAYEDVIALSYATDMFHPFAIGATIKRYASSIPVQTPTGESTADPSAAFYADLGFIFSKKGFLGGGIDSVHWGISVQNLGGDYVRYEGLEPEPVGQFLRAGVAYDLGLFMQDEQPRLRASTTLEYRRLLNPGEQRKDWTEYAGGGIEITGYDVASVRLGTVIFPGPNSYGGANKLTFRYGLGLTLPLRKIGMDIPLTFAVDYARMPSDDESTNIIGESSLREAMSIRAEYTAPVFK